MKLKPNENVLRVALIVFSIVFGILSISLIALGVVYIDELWWPKRYVGLDFLELPTLLIILGSASLMMSIAGCYCAKSYNRKVLLWFAAILLAILCLELTVAVIAFINFEEHEGKRTKTHNIMLHQIQNGTEDDQIFFAQLQDHFSCCGVTGTEDECKNEKPSSVLQTPEDNGCAGVINQQIQTVAKEIGYFSIALSLLQIIEVGYVYIIQQQIG